MSGNGSRSSALAALSMVTALSLSNPGMSMAMGSPYSSLTPKQRKANPVKKAKRKGTRTSRRGNR